jgi:hypothetical protein
MINIIVRHLKQLFSTPYPYNPRYDYIISELNKEITLSQLYYTQSLIKSFKKMVEKEGNPQNLVMLVQHLDVVWELRLKLWKRRI